MKKLLCFFLVCILSIISLTGCENSEKSQNNKSNEIDTDKISVGIIETRGNIEQSRILFLDDELNEIGSLPLDYANVGNVYEKALVLNNTLYVIPQGLDTEKDDKTVLEINLDNLDIKKHSIDQIALYGITADNDNIYTANNLNGVSHISKCNKNSGEVKTIDFASDYITKLFYSNNKLYAFSEPISDSEVRESDIYIYDDQLNLLQKVNTTEIGTGRYKVIEHNGYIYFTNMSDKNDDFGNTVGVLNTTDYSLETIRLTKDCPLDLQVYNNKLYVTHFNPIQGLSGGLTVYDLETKEQEYTDFNHGAEQMSIANNKMYILSDWKLYVYDMNTMELVQSTDISHIDNEFSFLSGLFVLDK